MVALYDRYSPHIFALCRHLTKTEDEAVVLLEEVFFRFWMLRHKLSVEDGNLLLYLQRMTILEHSRKTRQRQTL